MPEARAQSMITGMFGMNGIVVRSLPADMPLPETRSVALALRVFEGLRLAPNAEGEKFLNIRDGMFLCQKQPVTACRFFLLSSVASLSGEGKVKSVAFRGFIAHALYKALPAGKPSSPTRVLGNIACSYKAKPQPDAKCLITGVHASDVAF
jgi:hypothetical protein